MNKSFGSNGGSLRRKIEALERAIKRKQAADARRAEPVVFVDAPPRCESPSDWEAQAAEAREAAEAVKAGKPIVFPPQDRKPQTIAEWEADRWWSKEHPELFSE